MSEEEKDLKKKVEDLQEELKWLEAKFHRSGVDTTVRLKTLLHMQKRTQEFLIWLARRESEEAKGRAMEAGQIE
jgi:hypothetical protein